jgi:hypothetical protein
MYRLWISSDQRMPAWQWLALMNNLVGTGGGQPAKLFIIQRPHVDAIGYKFVPIGVVLTAASVSVE